RGGAVADDGRKREVGPRHSSDEAGEQSGRTTCGAACRGKARGGVGGAKGGGQGEYASAKHVLASEPGSRVKGAGAYTDTGAVIHPRREPYAGKLHVRIWAGGARKRVPTATPAQIPGGTRMTLRRREVMTLVRGAAAWPPAARAQQADKVWRIGFFSTQPRPVELESSRYGAFVQGMRELGHMEARDFVMEWRFAEGRPELYSVLAAELVQKPTSLW